MHGRASRQEIRSSATDSSLAEELVFVAVTSDEAARRGGPVNPTVRAHVTRIRHARANNGRKVLRDSQRLVMRPYIPRNDTDAAPETESAHANREISVERGSAESQDRRSDDSSLANTESIRPSSSSPASTPPLRSQSSGMQHVIAPRSSQPSGSPQSDPFWTVPVAYEVFLPPIFAHYIQNIAVEVPDLDGPTEHGLLRRRWFPLAMTEPATMYAVLLMSASHYYTVYPTQDGKADILYLKARALSEIRTAFSNSTHAVSDAVIGAVMKMAAYEAIFGEAEVYAAHMRGLRLMLRLRGGLDKLGLDGLLERMIVWIDFNAAHLTGLKCMVGGDDLPTGFRLREPDPGHFAGVS